MFALVFRFPAGRYHATPWGRHVNEGAVAWPPEPYRVLRALIAVWYRKADQARWDDVRLRRLIEALAQADPVYRLPGAVHAHTRHYMPQGKLDDGREKTALVFDAFYRIDPRDDLVVAWPDLTLAPDDFALAEHLAGLINYLGRAESIATAYATELWTGELPVRPGPSEREGWATVDVLAPLAAADYTAARPALLAQNRDKPKSKARVVFERTLPETLCDALQVETSQIQAAGWSRPPAGRLVSYARPEVGPRPPAGARRSPVRDDDPSITVARLILSGRPRPPITEAVKIGEVFRRALMARVRAPVPSLLSGRDEAGAPLRDPAHAHAFFLPEDQDGDGFIDHLVFYARTGVPWTVLDALAGLEALWIKDRNRRDPEDEGDDGRREWRVALEGYGAPETFSDSALLRPSKVWISATPYLRPRHLKGRDVVAETEAMVKAECRLRGLPEPDVSLFGEGERAGRDIQVGDARRNVLSFHRFRSRHGLIQPDRTGSALRLTFGEHDVPGPLALGFGCHYGLGLFRVS